MNIDNFSPIGATVNIAVTTSTGRVALTDNTHLSGDDVRLYNSGSVVVFFAFGNSTIDATVTSTPLAPGASEVFDAGRSTHVAAITASGTATLYATSGRGS